MKKLFIENRESGASIIEFIVAFGLVITTASINADYFLSLMKHMQNKDSLEVSMEYGHIIKSDMDRLLDRLQKRITEHPISKQCRPEIVENDFYRVVQNFRQPHIYTYFGSYSKIKYMKGFPSSLSKSLEDISFWARKNQDTNKKASRFVKAWNRCVKQSIDSGSLRNKSSFYLCGFSKNAIVEVKATFWDFNNHQPLKCEKMNGMTGRGLRGVYTVHNFRKLGTTKSSRYSLNHATGRVYVSKDVN